MLSFNGKEELKIIAINRTLFLSKKENMLTDLGLENKLPFKNELFIPEWLEILIESLNNNNTNYSKVDFLRVIPVGVDLDQIKTPFMLIVLKSNYKNFDHNKFPNVKKCLDVVIELYETGKINDDKFRKEAEAAAQSAESAAWSAAESAESARSARSAAWSAAWSAARSAVWSAESARSAVTYAAESARSAESDWAAAWAARSAESTIYEYFSKELLKLLKEC